MSYPSLFQSIFLDHHAEIEYFYASDYNVLNNVDRMLDCGNLDAGYAIYECKKCEQIKFVPFHCKSRFCPSCGVKYAMMRSNSMKAKFVNCDHRHIVFTIDENLRPFFKKDHKLLNLLFDSVNELISAYFDKINKKEHFTPGFVCVLHTFGRDLKWNPHIHCVCSEGGAGNSEPWRKVTHFNFKFFRKAFQKILLEKMLDAIGDSFKTVLSKSYKDHKEGFYVYAKDPKDSKNQKPTLEETIKYIGRYLGRPVIAMSRIDKYDGENVTFHYNRHEDDVYVEETIPVMDFIDRLVQHIPDRHFKMMRYFGIYAKHHKQESKIRKRYEGLKNPQYKAWNDYFLTWKSLMISCFNVDPIECPCCKKDMTLMTIKFNNGKETMEQHFEKLRRKSYGFTIP